MSYQLYIKTDQLPKSLNKKLRSHYFVRQRENRAWVNLILLNVGGRLPPKPLERALISIVRHSHRMLDYDGLAGSVKPVVDALKNAGIIIDDRWSVTGRWNLNQKFRAKSEGPLLEILVQGLPIDKDL